MRIQAGGVIADNPGLKRYAGNGCGNGRMWACFTPLPAGIVVPPSSAGAACSVVAAGD